MPSSSSADPPEGADGGRLDALIGQADRLRGGIHALHGGGPPASAAEEDPEGRWQRALWELAAHQADDLGGQLTQLRDGPPAPAPGGPHGSDRPAGWKGAAPEAATARPGIAAYGDPAATADGRSLVKRVGSAEWDLLTDEVTWSEELYRIFGRTVEDGPLSLDELPSWVWDEDQGPLMLAVTDCLVDGRPIDGEFRVVRPDGGVRTVHMTGEPVLDHEGGTASMWAVLRDVSELRRSEQAVRESRQSLQQERHAEQTERRLVVELQQSVLPPWRRPQRLPQGGDRAGSLDVAAHYLPAAVGALVGGCWYDAFELPGGASLLTVGGLTGHGAAATSGMAQLVGALRGMSLAGVRPGPLLGHLNDLLDSASQPALGSALCCRYQPATRSLTWSQASHPAPLLIRDGSGTRLAPPDGVLLGATCGAEYGQRTEQLTAGDVLVLHTDGLAPPDRGGVVGRGGVTDRLLALAPRLASARTSREGLRLVAGEFGGGDREDDACVLVARVE
ncbi:hypothetical protein N566_14705 [Streptomycetaceae bacterium MP113-05]|nr:hypothetical protein N566_14705 [Streptomycetaceae bacterium MP113-05]